MNYAHAQEDFYCFERLHYIEDSREARPTVFETDAGFEVVGAMNLFFGNHFKIMYFKSNCSGNSLMTGVTAIDTATINVGWYGSAFKNVNRQVGAGAYNYQGEVDPYFYKLKSNGEADTLVIFHRDSFNYFSQGKLSHDGNFIFAGVTDEFDPRGDYYLVKTDTNANIIWERTLGTNKLDYASSVDLAQDGGYFVFGESRGYGNFIGTYSQSLLIKTDSTGNEQWRKHWGGLTNECAWNVVPTPDSGVVTCGCWSDDLNNNQKHAYLRKMDKLGNLQWDTIFQNFGTPTQFNNFRMCRVLGNGNIVAVGDGLIDGSLVPMFKLFDKNGVVLHQRNYDSFLSDTVTSSIYHTDALFEDIRPTSDGGFIAGGTYYPGAGDTGNQDMFIVKLDSIGCEYPNCYDVDTTDTTIGIQDVAEKSQDFRAYPNPFDDSITFETNGNTGSHILIYDLRGVLIETLTIQKDQVIINLDTHQLSAGIYFAFLEKAGLPVQSIKIIKY